ncbi:MAG: hypothetical protein V1929_06930 [bacterium]
MRTFLTTMILAVVLLSLGCNSPREDVWAISLSDNKVVGTLRPSTFGTFRDMVLSTDDETGRFAVIEWGAYQSAIKVVSLDKWSVKTHRVGVGRSNGIDGAEHYEIKNNLYMYHDTNGLHIYDDKGGHTYHSNSIPRDFWPSRIIPCKGGYLVQCGKATGDYVGDIVYRFDVGKQTFAVSNGTDAPKSEVAADRGKSANDLNLNLSSNEVVYGVTATEDLTLVSLGKQNLPERVLISIAADGTKQECFRSARPFNGVRIVRCGTERFAIVAE